MKFRKVSIVLGICMVLAIGVMTTSANDNNDDMPDWLFPLFGGMLCFFWIIPIIIWIVIGVWMYKDAKRRGENGALWLIIGLIAGNRTNHLVDSSPKRSSL
jgi:hypothetical protein